VEQEERSQLGLLMRTLKDDYAQLEESKRVQEEENRALKDRLLSGNFVQRNKLVRGQLACLTVSSAESYVCRSAPPHAPLAVWTLTRASHISAGMCTAVRAVAH
jgi:hypothetical protein